MEYNYYDANLNHETSKNDTLECILSDLQNLYVEGSFLTLVNDEKEILHFMIEKDDKWLVDIPKMEEGIYFQKYTDIEEVCVLTEKFYNKESIDTSKFKVGKF